MLLLILKANNLTYTHLGWLFLLLWDHKHKQADLRSPLCHICHILLKKRWVKTYYKKYFQFTKIEYKVWWVQQKTISIKLTWLNFSTTHNSFARCDFNTMHQWFKTEIVVDEGRNCTYLLMSTYGNGVVLHCVVILLFFPSNRGYLKKNKSHKHKLDHITRYAELGKMNGVHLARTYFSEWSFFMVAIQL